MGSVCIQMPVAEQMADAARDDRRLRRALVGGGAALLIAVCRTPGGGRALYYAYYGVLLAVALFGTLEVAVGFWVSDDPERRRGWGQVAVSVSIVTFVLVAGLGGSAVLK
jgi:hypothetical protein